MLVEFLPCWSDKKHFEGHLSLRVWLFFISLKSVNLKEWNCVRLGWSQPHQAIRQEINTAVGPAPAVRLLITGLTGHRRKHSCHGGDASTIYSFILQEIFKFTVRLSKIMKELNRGFWFFWNLFLQMQILLSWKLVHMKSTSTGEATYTTLHFKILCIIYLFAYRNMYFYCTFYYYIYRIYILSIQHIPGRYIKYAHGSCYSVHPFNRSILKSHSTVYTCWKYTLCKSIQPWVLS